MRRRWLFADQLGEHFLDSPDQPALLVESKAVFRRRRFHRQKAHLVLSGLRHRAAELGDRAVFVRTDTYGEALDRLDEPVDVCHPTSWKALHLVERLARSHDVELLPARGYATSRETFEAWAGGRGRRRLLMEDFYRDARRRLDVLMEGTDPVGGAWNYDADNRQSPPKGVVRLDVAEPWLPDEDEIDASVREDLDRWERAGEVSFTGRDGPRCFAVTRAEATTALDRFVTQRLGSFGPYEDAMLAGDPWMSHSMLSAPMNLGLLDPVECVRRAEQAYRDDRAPLSSVEGYTRQLIGWRDYMWHLYWHLGEDYPQRNELQAREPLPAWFTELDADAVGARCLRDILVGVRDRAWVHHIPRLMVLGNYALQRGWDPAQLTAWFHHNFVDGYDWVMATNVVGMSQHADSGVITTKPYAGGGAYINRMSDYCGGCAYQPSKRIGDTACPFTTGYWAFLHRNRERLGGNFRMRQPLANLRRIADIEEVVAHEKDRDGAAP